MKKFNFYKESRSYMAGYSNWYFFRRLPIAYAKFKYSQFKDWRFEGKRGKR